MSSKIDLSEVIAIINAQKLSPPDTQALIKEIKARAQTKEADADIKPPAAKKQFVIVVSDPEGHLAKHDFTGWVVQVTEDSSPHTTVDRIKRAAHDFNASKKGRLLPVKSVGEALESVSRKYFTEAEVSVKTKLPVYVVKTDNTLGEAPSV